MAGGRGVPSAHPFIQSVGVSVRGHELKWSSLGLFFSVNVYVCVQVCRRAERSVVVLSRRQTISLEVSTGPGGGVWERLGEGSSQDPGRERGAGQGTGAESGEEEASPGTRRPPPHGLWAAGLQTTVARYGCKPTGASCRAHTQCQVGVRCIDDPHQPPPTPPPPPHHRGGRINDEHTTGGGGGGLVIACGLQQW